MIQMGFVRYKIVKRTLFTIQHGKFIEIIKECSTVSILINLKVYKIIAITV